MTKSYFAESEMACPCCGRADMNRDFMGKLNALREACGFSLNINSGYRCPDHNAKIGSKVNSAHVRGRAADIACTDSHKRFVIISEALELGFKRIGVGSSFIHIDDSDELPQGVIWGYK